MGEILDAAFQGDVADRLGTQLEFAAGVLHADAVHVVTRRTSKMSAHDAGHMLGTSPRGAHQTCGAFGEVRDFFDAFAGEGQPLRHRSSRRARSGLEKGVESQQELLQGKTPSGGSSQGDNLSGENFHLRRREAPANGKLRRAIVKGSKIIPKTRLQISQHPGREGEIDEDKTVAVHRSEDMPIRGAHENQVSGIQSFVLAIDRMTGTPGFDPEDFREIVRMKKCPAVGQKAKPRQVIPLPGLDQVTPELLFHKINIAQDNVKAYQDDCPMSCQYIPMSISKESLRSAPPLAGLATHAEAALPGLGVDATVERLRRYVYLETQCFFLLSAYFNSLPEWEVKGAISLHLWQDAEHNTWFRNRITEMRTPPHNLDKVPDPALETFVGELRKAATTAEFLTGIYGVLKPALAASYEALRAAAHPIADQPTRRLLRFVLEEKAEQLAWGREALAALAPASKILQDWEAHLQAYLAAAGGADGTALRIDPGQPLRRAVLFPPSQAPRRDARFSRVWNSRGVVPAPESPVHERIWWMMNVRLNEMHVSELIASVITDWKGQPWTFYHELARHLWDETRHCMLGEVAFVSQGIDFTKIPTHVGFADYPNTKLEPADRYAFLWGIEQGLMVKSGKQAEVALAKAGHDERATIFQDFDWADEVLHAQIGRRWLEQKYGNREEMNAAYERVRPSYDQMKDDDLRLPGRDWWPEFYARFLKDKDPNPVQEPDAAPPVADGGY